MKARECNSMLQVFHVTNSGLGAAPVLSPPWYSSPSVFAVVSRTFAYIHVHQYLLWGEG